MEVVDSDEELRQAVAETQPASTQELLQFRRMQLHRFACAVPTMPSDEPTLPEGPSDAPTLPEEPCVAPTLPEGPSDAPTLPEEPCVANTLPEEHCVAPTLPEEPCVAPTLPEGLCSPTMPLTDSLTVECSQEPPSPGDLDGFGGDESGPYSPASMPLLPADLQAPCTLGFPDSARDDPFVASPSEAEPSTQKTTYIQTA